MKNAELPSLRHLRMFEAVARLESVSRAALEVNRSQPAVTQALAKLERTLGVHLIERRHSGSYLTDFGRIVLLRTQRLFALIELALTQPLVGAPFADTARLGPIVERLTSNHVACLIAIADGGTVSSARRGTNVTPRTLSRSAREIELIVGRRITRRSAQGTNLTQGGVELARQLRVAIKEMDYAQEEIAAARGEAQTTISIGAMPQCAMLVLASAIDEFMRCEPAAQIRIAHGPYDLLLGDLRMGRIDFLFGVLRRPEWASDVDEEALFDAPYAIIARRNHPLSRKRTLELDDFADYEWILPQQGTPRRLAFERMFQGARRKPKSSIETSKSDLQATLIAASDRITMMSVHEALRLAGGGTTVALDYRPKVARGSDGIATRAGWHPTAGSRLFLEIVRKQGISAAIAIGRAGETIATGSLRRKRQHAAVSA